MCLSLAAHHIVKVDGKRGLFRGLSPRIVSSAISTVVRSKVKQVLTSRTRFLLTRVFQTDCVSTTEGMTGDCFCLTQIFKQFEVNWL